MPDISSNVADQFNSAAPSPGVFTSESLVDEVYNSFSAKNRSRISRDNIAEVVASLELSEERLTLRSASLRILQLRFTGEKRLRDHDPKPIDYDQVFAPGVNVICIPDNEVGKSSILKTIKYALTGDNSDYDADVRSWIADVWLAFALDRQEFTILLSTRGEAPHALLVPGQEFRSIEILAEDATLALFDVYGTDNIKIELQRFFFQRLGLSELSWTQNDQSVPSGVAERSTSWSTYFQALEIPDGGDRYLLCDPQHAIGNQEGLIFSEFLGLHLVDPLNKLHIEAALARKEVRNKNQLTAEQLQQAHEEISRLESDIQSVRMRLNELDMAQAARRQAVEGGSPAIRLVEVQLSLTEKSSEKMRLESEREELNQIIQRRRARERQLRELAALRLHFTGLEVSLCPNCDSAVGAEAVQQEHAAHICRLCSKKVESADQSEVDTLRAEADDIKREMEDAVRGRNVITTRLGTTNLEIDALVAELDSLTSAAKQGIAFALPTSEEEIEQKSLHEQVGRLEAELILARQRAEPPTEDDEVELQVRILERVRRVLGQEAGQRNGNLLERLSSLTQDMTYHIGAESVSDVSCSPLGQVQLKKHGEQVRFTGVQNEGERLRIKLAFFLAMIRLGREPGLGRHPGLLLIDQPGSSEMVQEDLESMAHIFRGVDADLGNEVQIICCTARSEFKAATDPNKVYGPQDPPFAF